MVAVLVGRPNDPAWDQVHQDAFRLLEESASHCHFTSKCRRHRRGNFAVLNAGISFGSGQDVRVSFTPPSAHSPMPNHQEPKTLCHSDARTQVLDRLLKSAPFSRLAGLASGAFATWMPKLHGYYSEKFDQLLSHHGSDLQRNFSNSVWAVVAFNFGPWTITRKHRDCANLPYGVCSITALGHYDYVKGGHIVLWEFGLVIEFPPGSTVLIPSAAVSHSNTPIAREERRGSVTQYTAGGIFRWIDQGFQLQDEYRKGLSEEEMELIPVRDEERCAFGLSLFSTLDELKGNKTTKT